MKRDLREVAVMVVLSGGGGVEPVTIMPVQIFQAMGACWRAFMLQWAASSPPSDTVRYKEIIFRNEEVLYSVANYGQHFPASAAQKFRFR